jgi:hypothetical protein
MESNVAKNSSIDLFPARAKVRHLVGSFSCDKVAFPDRSIIFLLYNWAQCSIVKIHQDTGIWIKIWSKVQVTSTKTPNKWKHNAGFPVATFRFSQIILAGWFLFSQMKLFSQMYGEKINNSTLLSMIYRLIYGVNLNKQWICLAICG